MTHAGYATNYGTERLFLRSNLPRYAYKNLDGKYLSKLGFGTYRHGSILEINKLCSALEKLLQLGCNVIDSAPNYGFGLIEKRIGETLSRIFENGSLSRDEIFIMTKAGLASEGFDFCDKFVMGPDDSCYDPNFFFESIICSLRDLQINTIDCIFIHNLELMLYDKKNFQYNFYKLGLALDEIVNSGLARAWGISSWSGFRVEREHKEYLSISWILEHKFKHLKYLQIPFGLWASEAKTVCEQKGKSILDYNHGLTVFANSPLMHGFLPQILPKEISAEDAICFSRNMPGISVVIVGISSQQNITSWVNMQNCQNSVDLEKLKQYLL